MTIRLLAPTSLESLANLLFQSESTLRRVVFLDSSFYTNHFERSPLALIFKISNFAQNVLKTVSFAPETAQYTTSSLLVGTFLLKVLRQSFSQRSFFSCSIFSNIKIWKTRGDKNGRSSSKTLWLICFFCSKSKEPGIYKCLMGWNYAFAMEFRGLPFSQRSCFQFCFFPKDKKN